METRDYIESGILELYVYGLLSDSENEDVLGMTRKHPEVLTEIISIEKAIIDLSASFSQLLPAENFEKIRERLIGKQPQVIEMPKTRRSAVSYIGWAAALVLLAAGAYLYRELSTAKVQVADAINEKTNLQKNVLLLNTRNTQTENVLAMLRDRQNTVIALEGHTAAPDASAKIYWNKETQAVYVDAAGLPLPPEGSVYQVWSLKLSPLAHTNIGLLENFSANRHLIFALNNTTDAEGFGITLEPAGGSEQPTMEQMYVLSPQ